MKTKLLLTIIAVIAFGCAMPGGPGYIYQNTSQFDGATGWTVDPVYVSYGLQIGATSTGQLPDDKLVMTVQVFGFHQLSTLDWNIDGVISHFAPLSATQFASIGSGQYYQKNGSIQRYIVPVALIKDAITAHRAVVRVNSLDGTAIEGIFSDGGSLMTAKGSLSRFYNQVYGDDL